MSQLTISEAARQVGSSPSAIRYYERLGILPSPERKSGRRRHDRTVLFRLAVVQRAREAGFALEEIRALFFGFKDGTHAEKRWSKLADRKLTETETLAERIKTMQQLLKRMKSKCRCKTLEECSKAIPEKGVSTVERPPLPVSPQLYRLRC